MPSLTVVESVRCLECGFVYAKPAAGGTVLENPGCPECGYVGWVAADRVGAFTEAWSRRHSGADRLQHPRG
jgi:predicted  nucleic acid-binding Zn-ribbon protein